MSDDDFQAGELRLRRNDDGTWQEEVFGQGEWRQWSEPMTVKQLEHIAYGISDEQWKKLFHSHPTGELFEYMGLRSTQALAKKALEVEDD